MVKLASRSRSLGFVAALLVGLEGCGLVVGLGDPNPLGQGEDAGTGITSETNQPQATQIAVGASHACAVIDIGPGSPENGSVRCWGSNSQGELGSDPTGLPSTSRPREVPGFPLGFAGASHLALSDGYSCAVSTDGYLFCWGGVPAEVPAGIHREQPVPAYQPSLVDLLDKKLVPVTAMGLEANGGCIIEQQSLVCWGELAIAAGRDAGVDGGAAVTYPGYLTVTAGSANACAVASDNGADDIDCWGDDTFGQSGGFVGGSIPYPTPIGLSGDVRQLAAGADFACALMGDGAVSCWGNNDRGQLGPDGPAGSSAIPVAIRFSDAMTASALALGDRHACAVMTDSNETVQCWGDNLKGQLGAGPSGPAEYSAATVAVQRAAADGGSEAVPHVSQIAAGGGTTCVVRVTDPLVSCWGANGSGQAGQPASPRVLYATPVPW